MAGTAEDPILIEVIEDNRKNDEESAVGAAVVEGMDGTAEDAKPEVGTSPDVGDTKVGTSEDVGDTKPVSPKGKLLRNTEAAGPYFRPPSPTPARDEAEEEAQKLRRWAEFNRDIEKYAPENAFEKQTRDRTDTLGVQNRFMGALGKLSGRGRKFGEWWFWRLTTQFLPHWVQDQNDVPPPEWKDVEGAALAAWPHLTDAALTALYEDYVRFSRCHETQRVAQVDAAKRG